MTYVALSLISWLKSVRRIAESSMAAARPCTLALIPRLSESGLFSRLIEVRRAWSWGSVRCRSRVAFLTRHFRIVEIIATIPPSMVDFKIAGSSASRHYGAPLEVHSESLVLSNHRNKVVSN
jgi:hypothetical protein